MGPLCVFPNLKRSKGLNYFKQNCLVYFGLQYKPSSGAEWKKYVKRKPLQIKIRDNDWTAMSKQVSDRGDITGVLYSVLFHFGHICRGISVPFIFCILEFLLIQVYYCKNPALSSVCCCGYTVFNFSALMYHEWICLVFEESLLITTQYKIVLVMSDPMAKMLACTL